MIASAALCIGGRTLAGPQAPDAPAPIAAESASTAAASPNDLHPRPLGPKRDTKPTIGATADHSTAAGTLLNNPVVRTGGSLAIVLILIVGLAAITKKIAAKSGLAGQLGAGGRAPEGLLEVLGRYPLSRGQTLILLKVDSRILLLSQTTPRIRGGVGALSTLCEIADPEEVASILVKAGEHAGDAHSAKFTALLGKFDRTHEQALPDHTEIEVKGRRIQRTTTGDRAEMLDDRAIPIPAAAGIYQPAPPPPPQPPVIHKFPHPTELPSHNAGDSFNAIRQRLHALHGEAHR